MTLISLPQFFWPEAHTRLPPEEPGQWYLPEQLNSPMWITLYKNKTILFVVGDILLGIVIENKTISENFKEYFELIWNISKK